MCRWRDGLAELIFALRRPQRLTMLRGRCACTRRAYQTADDVVASATITFDRPRLPWQLPWRDHIFLCDLIYYYILYRVNEPTSYT